MSANFSLEPGSVNLARDPRFWIWEMIYDKRELQVDGFNLYTNPGLRPRLRFVLPIETRTKF